MNKDKSFALYAASEVPMKFAGDYVPFTRTGNDGKARTIWVRVELHDCHFNDAMDKVALRDGENFLNTQPA